MEATLDHVIEELKSDAEITRASEQESSTNTQSILKDIVETENKIYAGINQFVSFLKGNKLFEVEKAREQSKHNKDLVDAIKNIPDPNLDKEPDVALEKSGGIIGLIAAGLVAGIVSVFKSVLLAQFKIGKWLAKLSFKPISIAVSTISKHLTALAKFLGGKLFKGIKLGFTSLANIIRDSKLGPAFNKIGRVITVISERFTSLLTKLSSGASSISTKIDEFIKMFKSSFVVTGIAKIGTFINTYFKNIGTNIKGVFGAIKSAFSIFTGSGIIGSAISGFSKVFGSVGTWFTNISKIMGPIVGVLKRLFIPLQIFLTLKAAIEGMIDGYKEDGIIGAVKGAIKGIFTSLIGGLLDLLKDGISWLSEKMGFGNFSAMLDSFSFSELGGQMIDSIFGFFKKAVNGIVDLFSGKLKVSDVLPDFSEFGDMASNFVKQLLRSILPDPDGDYLSSLASKAIPNSIYEYAGMNPVTGDVIQNPLGSSNGIANEVVAAESVNLERGRAQQQLNVIAPSDNSNTSNSVDNSTQQINVNTNSSWIDRSKQLLD